MPSPSAKAAGCLHLEAVRQAAWAFDLAQLTVGKGGGGEQIIALKVSMDAQ